MLYFLGFVLLRFRDISNDNNNNNSNTGLRIQLALTLKLISPTHSTFLYGISFSWSSVRPDGSTNSFLHTHTHTSLQLSQLIHIGFNGTSHHYLLNMLPQLLFSLNIWTSPTKTKQKRLVNYWYLSGQWINIHCMLLSSFTLTQSFF